MYLVTDTYVSKYIGTILYYALLCSYQSKSDAKFKWGLMTVRSRDSLITRKSR